MRRTLLSIIMILGCLNMAAKSGLPIMPFTSTGSMHTSTNASNSFMVKSDGGTQSMQPLPTVFDRNSYTLPVAAKNVKGGVLSTPSSSAPGYRRVISDDDDDLRPGYDREDPFSTPVGDLPIAFMTLLALAYAAVILRRRLKGYKVGVPA